MATPTLKLVKFNKYGHFEKSSELFSITIITKSVLNGITERISSTDVPDMRWRW